MPSEQPKTYPAPRGSCQDDTSLQASCSRTPLLQTHRDAIPGHWCYKSTHLEVAGSASQQSQQMCYQPSSVPVRARLWWQAGCTLHLSPRSASDMSNFGFVRSFLQQRHSTRCRHIPKTFRRRLMCLSDDHACKLAAARQLGIHCCSFTCRGGK